MSPQLESLMMNCLTRFLWATEAFEKLFYIFLLSQSFMSFYTCNCYLVIFFLTLKSNPPTNRRIQTSVIMPEYKAFNKKYFRSSFLESLTWTSKYSNNMPWPQQESTKQSLRCEWKANNLQWEHTIMNNYQKPSLQRLISWQKHFLKSGSGLLRIYSL